MTTTSTIPVKNPTLMRGSSDHASGLSPCARASNAMPRRANPVAVWMASPV